MSQGVSAQATPYATDWVQGHNSRARIIIGGAPAANGSVERYAALEIALEPGWKTYWRQPGSAGGIPPYLDWNGSENLKRTTLKFPAPKRMVDPTGATIGYKNSVVLPVKLEPGDTSAPMIINLNALFGVCREICIPAQAAFKVTLPAALFRQTPPELAKALARVPRSAGDTTAVPSRAPALVASGKAPGNNAGNTLAFDVRFPGGTAGADLFAETGDHQSLAMSRAVAHPASDVIRYHVEVPDSETWQALGKNGIVLTMVSDAGASELRMPRP